MTLSYLSNREAVLKDVRRRHDLARMIESFCLLAFAGGAGGLAYYLTLYKNQWSATGGSLAISGTIVAALVIWLLGRVLLGARPFTVDDSDFERWTDEEIARITALHAETAPAQDFTGDPEWASASLVRAAYRHH